MLLEVEGGTIWQEFLSVAFDPAHILAELFFTIVFDGLVIAVLYQIVFKKLLLPRMCRDIHRQIDEEHGLGHDDEHGVGLHEKRVKHEHGTSIEQGSGYRRSAGSGAG